MNDKSLKRALFVAIGLCTVLAAALAYTASHREGRVHAQGDSDPVVASGPADTKPGTKVLPPASTDEPALTPIQLSPRHLQEIGVTTALVEMKDTSSEVEAPGSVAMDEQRLSSVQTRFPGWIRTVFANATYQYVKKGQNLFTIYSPDLVSTEQEVLLAKQNQATSSEHMHGTPANEGNWLLQAAEERLRRFDVPDAEIARIEQSGSVEREVAIESPASGYIIERNALPNVYVQPETKLYTIADLSTVWVYANVFQTDVGRLKPGDHARVTVDAYPGRKFNGRVDQVLPEVDQATRTVRVRLIFSNPGVMLKPGMYVDVNMSAPLGRRLVIPSSGVLQAGSRQIAFIDHGQGSLEPREIETGPRLDDSIVVLKGLKAGDRIVSSANFLIDSEAQLQGSMGGFAPLPTAAGAGQKSTDQLQVDFATQPSPARKGWNTLRVNLTGADGKPVAGAEVSVTFFMSAMPAMGMSSMRVVASLADKGQGAYEGPVQLGAGGTWDVTVTAIKSGQTVANKKLSVNASGGM
jgi:Cu(I)/Ag(I) efflux system membrane fusion protein/cobalt-zinc-cadmium efflux system membrane fusion protein